MNSRRERNTGTFVCCCWGREVVMWDRKEQGGEKQPVLER